MNPIKRLSVTYDTINENNTFSSGDHISGRVTLEVEKETKIDSFLVKAKGKATVLWTERYGQFTMVYHDKETLFKLEHFFICETKKGRLRFNFGLNRLHIHISFTNKCLTGVPSTFFSLQKATDFHSCKSNQRCVSLKKK